MNGVPHVFAAISRGVDDASDIIVWQRVAEKVVELESMAGNRETWRAFKDALQVIMCAATIAFIWQNLGVRICIAEKHLY